MTRLLFISLLFFLGLNSLPSSVSACNVSGMEEMACCQKETKASATSRSVPAQQTTPENPSEKDCGRRCNHSLCFCGVPPGLPVSYHFTFDRVNNNELKNAHKLPVNTSIGYFAIWRPPKLIPATSYITNNDPLG